MAAFFTSKKPRILAIFLAILEFNSEKVSYN